MGSPPQIETIGAPHSSTAFRHCSTVSISLMVDLYSRMRPQPVHVRLHACSGSSIITSGNFSAPPMLFFARYPAMLAVKLKGTLIHYPRLQLDAVSLPQAPVWRKNFAGLCAYCHSAPMRTAGRNFDTGDTSGKTRTGNPSP